MRTLVPLSFSEKRIPIRRLPNTRTGCLSITALEAYVRFLSIYGYMNYYCCWLLATSLAIWCAAVYVLRVVCYVVVYLLCRWLLYSWLFMCYWLLDDLSLLDVCIMKENYTFLHVLMALTMLLQV